MSVARSYAKALYEAAIDTKITGPAMDPLEQQLSSAADLITTNPALKTALFTPATGTKEKVGVVTEIVKRAQYHPLVSNFLILMARKHRLDLVTEISAAFKSVRIETEGGVVGQLTSADPLDPADIESISQAFSKKLGKKVVFQTFTNPEMLAGMKVTVNGVTYDGTLRSQLQQLRDQLVYGTSMAH